MTIAISAGNHHIYIRLVKKLDLDIGNTVFVDSHQKLIGLHVDRIIRTCGYSDTDVYYSDLITRFKTPESEIEYIACCNRFNVSVHQ